jgi:Zn-dependent M28 family amino/carboxypeptidase
MLRSCFIFIAFIFTNGNVVGNSDSLAQSAARLKSDVYALVGTPKPRNYENLASLNQAADYISNEFKKLGLIVEEQRYTTMGAEYKNIIVSFGPKDAERLIVGAHYDVCSHQDGADDNASGTAGLLELARMLKWKSPELEYRIDLVAYTLEEPPFFRTDEMGSAVHAKSLHDAGVEVKGMICLEMIGYFSEERGSQDYPIGCLKLVYPRKGNYIALVGKLGKSKILRQTRRKMRKEMDMKIKSITAPSWVPGIDFSDHLNYWKYGYRAVMVTDTAFYRNKHYHQPTDTAEKLDFDKMADIVAGVFNAITAL